MRTSHTCNSTDPRPNILFLQADDFARATISAYQSHLAPIVKTPHIDKLAAEGAIFDRSFVTNSLCAPSRTVILTGLHSHENGVIHITNSADQNGVCEGCKQKFEMAKGVVAYPQMLRGAGYATALFGKYHSHDFAWGARAFEHFRPVERHVYWDPKLCRAGNKLKCDAQPTQKGRGATRRSRPTQCRDSSRSTRRRSTARSSADGSRSTGSTTRKRTAPRC